MIVLAVVLALLLCVLLVPIKIYVRYRGGVSLWVCILAWKRGILPRPKKTKPEKKAVRSGSDTSADSKSQKSDLPPEAKQAETEKPEERRESFPPEPEKKAPDSGNKESENKENEEEKTASEQKEKNESLPERIARYLKLAEEFLGPLRKAVRQLVKAESLEVTVSVGTEDAAKTAVYSGMLWSIGYNIIALADRIVKIRSQSLKVEPVYGHTCLKAEGDCILRTSLANIIAAAAILGIAYLRYKLKNRRNKNERASVK